jgi:hypothetical protein
MELLPHLCRPRFPGTEGERQTSRLISERLRAAGLDVREEEFPVSGSGVAVRRAMGLSGLALLAAAWVLAGTLPAASALILLALFGAALLSGRLWLALADRGGSGGPGTFLSRNIIASPAGKQPSLYLSAHYDSKSQSLPLVVGLGLALALSGTLLALAGLLLASGYLRPAADALFGLAALLAVILALQSPGNASPGALDNGAAVALLLGLAEALPPTVGLIFFGAEELGLLGSLAFARRHPEARTQTFVNLDGIGLAGRLRLFGGRQEPGGRLLEAARRAGVALGASPLWPGLLMDHVALRRAGLRAASLGCVGGASMRIHSAADTVDAIEPEGLRAAAALLLALAQPLGPAGPAARIAPLHRQRLFNGRGAGRAKNSALPTGRQRQTSASWRRAWSRLVP